MVEGIVFVKVGGCERVGFRGESGVLEDEVVFDVECRWKRFLYDRVKGFIM